MTDEPLEGELVERGDTLPAIALPPDHVFKSAFFTAIKYRTVKSAIRAYNAAILERAATETAIATLNEAHLQALRTVEKLKDAHMIHEMDRLNRETDLIEARNQHAQAKHEAKLSEMGRHAELRHAQLQAGEEVSDLSEDEKEIVEALLSKIKPARYRSLLEQAIKDKHLSSDDEEKAREIMESLIAQSV